MINKDSYHNLNELKKENDNLNIENSDLHQ